MVVLVAPVEVPVEVPVDAAPGPAPDPAPHPVPGHARGGMIGWEQAGNRLGSGPWREPSGTATHYGR